jgi:hypothetical protein
MVCLLGAVLPCVGGIPVGGVRMTLRPDDTPVEPGTVLRRMVVVSNALSEPVDLMDEVRFPTGWRPLLAEDPKFTVEAGKSVLRILAFVVPRSAVGMEQLTYRLHPAKDGIESLGELRIPVRIQGRAGLRLELQETPEYLTPSVWSTSRVEVLNTGGVPLRVRLQAAVSPRAEIRLETNGFRLASGESRSLEFGVAPIASDSSRFSQALRVSAIVTEESGAAVPVPVVGTSLEVIGGASKAVDPWVRIPSRLQLGSGVDLDGRSAQFAQISGIGALDSPDPQLVSYRLRPAILGNSPLLLDQEEYSLFYQNTFLDLTLGDGNYALSPLIQSAWRDRGLRFGSHSGSTRGGALLAASAAPEGTGFRSGGYLEQDLTPWWTVRGNLLRQDPSSGTNGRPGGELASMVSRFWRTNRFRLELEAAQSDPDPRRSGAPNAFRADLTTRLPGKSTWNLQGRRIGGGFLSPTQDNDSVSSSLQVPLGARDRMDLSVNRTQVGLHGSVEEQPGQERTGEFLSQSASAGLNRVVDNRTHLSGGVQIRERELRNPAGQRGVEEQTASASASRQFGRWTPSFHVESGVAQDSRGGPQTSVARVGGRLTHRRTPKDTYGLFAQLGDPILAVDLDPSVSAGFSAEMEFGTRNRFELWGAHEFVPKSGARRESLVALARHGLANGSEVSLRTQVMENGMGSADAGFFLSYSIPFGMPVGRKRGLSSIHGRIYDQDDSLKIGVSKAVVTLNRELKAVTAADGSFSFTRLRPGTFLLEVESRSIGFGRLVAAPGPLAIVAKPDTATRVDVGVTAGATLEVILSVFEDAFPGFGAPKSPPSEGPRRKGPLAGEVVEVQMDKATRRQASDTQGLVRFSGLRSGSWHIRVGQGALPPNHFLEKSEMMQTLKPGATERVEFRVLPRRRVLRFIDDG